MKINGILRLAAAAVSLALLTAGCAGNAPAGPQGEPLVIPIREISETASYYPVTVDGTRMEALAVRAPDGSVRTAFNTCQVCSGSPKAYFVQKGRALECQNCRNQFSMNRVGIEAGGCNPVPVPEQGKTVTDEAITISYETLWANRHLFPANWKEL